MKLLAISGSLREDSYNTALLRNVDAEVVLWDELKELPHYSEDDDIEPVPPAVQRIREAVRDADAVLFSTPEYNGSVPGALKNAVDWLSRPRGEAPLLNKPVAVAGASTSMFGAVWAQADLRRILRTAGARVIETELPVAKAHQVFEGGRLLDAELHARLQAIVDELAAEVSAERIAA
ncbi:MAG: NADPH-dependent FMN reductase [Gaiellaceae bacterium]